MRYALPFIAIVMVTIVSAGTGLAGGAVTPLSEFGFLIEQVKKNTGEVFVIDVRERVAYLSGTVTGAVHAGTAPEGYIGDGRGGPVLVITQGDASAELLEQWEERLSTFGHDPIYFLDGGFASWVKVDGPVHLPEGAFAIPGTLPFVIPRGLCELNTPAKVYP